MSRFEVSNAERTVPANPEEGIRLAKSAFDRFGPGLLGLGDLTVSGEERSTVCTIFDLAGYTAFSRHVDPDLSVPGFLQEFLAWLFAQLRYQVTFKDHGDEVELHSDLPFYGKFMGDGALFLWPATSDAVANVNIAVYALNICRAYRESFLPEACRRYVEVPTRLRCGVARGRVLAVGGLGEDYVGPCINLASRLQKLGGLSFAVHRHGLDFARDLKEERFAEFRLRQTELRGIGPRELVWVLKEEEDALAEPERQLFREPECG